MNLVIECKRPDMKDPIDQAISQQLRNQRDDYIASAFSLACIPFF